MKLLFPLTLFMGQRFVRTDNAGPSGELDEHGRQLERDTMNDEASYICDQCGEEIVVPVDPSAGSRQDYVEDCPVCCAPNVIHVEIGEDGDIRVWAEAE